MRGRGEGGREGGEDGKEGGWNRKTNSGYVERKNERKTDSILCCSLFAFCGFYVPSSGGFLDRQQVASFLLLDRLVLSSDTHTHTHQLSCKRTGGSRAGCVTSHSRGKSLGTKPTHTHTPPPCLQQATAIATGQWSRSKHAWQSWALSCQT